MIFSTLTQIHAATEPAGGAALDQVAIATGGAGVVTALLLYLVMGHRSGSNNVLERAGARATALTGLPAWSALPSAVAAVFLQVALLGMYWDISLHIDQGRDPGPLANPAHYLILAGLFGVFSAGVLAIFMPRKGEIPGPAALRISKDWHAPVGGVLMAACGAFALIGFPLDDMWHRLFGQDVTLWGPTHLMLIGGAGMTLVGQAVLLVEGLRARPASQTDQGPRFAVALRRVGLMGGFLIGLSTFQGEFDFGVPQYRMVFQPLLIALAAGVALTAGRIWIGRGGALGAALFFVFMRGGIALIVGPILGETTPHLPLYLAEALCVEAVGFVLATRRPLAFGAVSGLLIGTVGFAAEYAWSHIWMPIPWSTDLLPESLILATVAGVAGGLVGVLAGLGLRGELPRTGVARTAVALAGCAIAACVGYGLHTSEPSGAKAQFAITGAGPEKSVRVTVSPASLVKHPTYVTITAWQDGGLVVDRLRKVGPAQYASTRPVPVHGDWKSLLRIQSGDAVIGAPIYLPEDKAIPAKEVPASAHVTRPLVRDTKILQRERKGGVAGWLWAAASALVLVLFLLFFSALAWGVGRFGRAAAAQGSRRPPSTPTGPSRFERKREPVAVG